MSVKNLSIVIVAHQPFFRHVTGENEIPGQENDLLFGAISQTYIPLIDMLHRFEEEGIKSKFSIVLSPSLCAMLSDEVLQKQYIQWLDRCILFGQKEVERLKREPELCKNAGIILEKAIHNKTVFVENYNCNLVKEFASFAKKGFIEILATTGTYAFLPHYSDMPEILNAQIETGIISHKHFFETAPEGFWLPYMGFAKGIERNLRSYGINYTLIDSHGLLFSESCPDTGIFAPVRCFNSLVLFARDRETPFDINDEENGYSANKVYKNQNKDAGFELTSQELEGFIEADSVRTNTLYRYWSKESDSNAAYDAEKAEAQAVKDAIDFINRKNEKLNKAAEQIEGDSTLTCTISAHTLGQTWAEGMIFLETVLRNNKESNFISHGQLIKDQFKLPKVIPYPSASSGTGYGEDLLDSSNCWMLRYTRKMCERMVDLAGRFPDDTGLKVRLLNIGAKELMLAQSGELAKMIHENMLPDFVQKYFNSSVTDFTAVFDALGSNVVSTEWLTKLEKKHNLFPWMNYRIFSQKM